MGVYIPSSESWDYFTENLKDIRAVVKMFLSEAQWKSMVGTFGKKTEYSLEQFDEAVRNKDVRTLSSIMNDAWGRAPEDRGVYRIPGFTPMCNLLDGTVEGFLGEDT